ncbi:MAG: type II secretion system protein [Phycisphaerales bacterium]
MKRYSAFTMIELVVVITVIGILAAIVVPKFANAQADSRVAAAGEDILSMARTVEQYYHKNGYWPADTAAGVTPPELVALLKNNEAFAKPCPIGNAYDYGHVTATGSHTVTIGLVTSLSTSSISQDDAAALDAHLDDGVLTTGKFQAVGTGYAYRVSQ